MLLWILQPSGTELFPMLFCSRTQVSVELPLLKRIPCLSSWWLWILCSYLQFAPTYTIPLECKHALLSSSSFQWPQSPCKYPKKIGQIQQTCALLQKMCPLSEPDNTPKTATRIRPCCWSFLLRSDSIFWAGINARNYLRWFIASFIFDDVAI